jgi:hypothetical protein
VPATHHLNNVAILHTMQMGNTSSTTKTPRTTIERWCVNGPKSTTRIKASLYILMLVYNVLTWLRFQYSRAIPCMHSQSNAFVWRWLVGHGM